MTCQAHAEKNHALHPSDLLKRRLASSAQDVVQLQLSHTLRTVAQVPGTLLDGASFSAFYFSSTFCLSLTLLALRSILSHRQSMPGWLVLTQHCGQDNEMLDWRYIRCLT